MYSQTLEWKQILRRCIVPTIENDDKIRLDLD